MSSPSGKYFAPKPGRFGKQLITLVTPCGLDTATSFTSSSTTTFDVPTPYRKLKYEKGSVHCRTLPGFSAAAGGVATIFRVRSGTGTAITASLTLDALTSGAASAFTVICSDPVMYINESDVFQVQVSLGTTSITTAAADLTFVIEAGILE